MQVRRARNARAVHRGRGRRRRVVPRECGATRHPGETNALLRRLYFCEPRSD